MVVIPPCIEVFFPELDRLIIINAGSGLRELGNNLMTHPQPVEAHLFLSHTHWDHIMGFPFFVPAYLSGTHIRMYGPATYEDESLEQVVGKQMTYRYSPIREAKLAANIQYFNLKEETLDLGDGIIIKTKYLNHPVLCLGYRIEYKGKVFCTTYDTEPFRNVFISDPEHHDYDKEMAEEGEQVAIEQNKIK